MISAVLSLIIGVLCLVSAVPIVLPVFGLILGANALLKERKKGANEKKKNIAVMAIIGIIANSFITLMFIMGGFIK